MFKRDFIRTELKQIPMSHGFFWLPFMFGLFMTIPLASLAENNGMVLPLFWLLVALALSLVGYLLFVIRRSKKLSVAVAVLVGVFLYKLVEFLYNYALAIELI